jgi:hypothetical protein
MTGSACRTSRSRINHRNGKKTDGFLLALTGERTDLACLPFARGDAGRTKGENSRQFALAVADPGSTDEEAEAGRRPP